MPTTATGFPVIAVGTTLASTVIVLWALHRAALWAEARGWIYYRTRGNPHAASISVMTLTSLYQPSVSHTIEEMTWERTEIVQSECGDDH